MRWRSDPTALVPTRLPRGRGPGSVRTEITARGKMIELDRLRADVVTAAAADIIPYE
jgi:hypothetical protein